MTEIKATVSGKHYRIEAKNHADNTNTCAIISAFICTLAGAAQLNPEAKSVHTKLEPGDAMVQYIATGDTAEEDMRIILLGLIRLEADFPDAIHVEQNIFK